MKRSKHGFIRLAMVFAVIHILMFSLISMAAPLSNNPAQTLYDLGLVLGTGTNDEGLPEFSLDAQMTRSEAIVMLVRMLGAERLSMFDSYTSPFTDVPAWAENHIGYAYATGMTNGVSETLFDGNSYVDQKQFCTLMLRALGYDDKEGDFVWSQSDSLAQALGLISSSKNSFTREDAFEICYNALLTKVKTGDMTLLQILANANAINADQIDLYGLTSYQVPLHYYAKYPDIPSALNVYPNITLEYDFDIDVGGKDKFSEMQYYYFDCHSLEESKAVASVYSKFLEHQNFLFVMSEDNAINVGEDIQYILLTPDQSRMVTIHPKGDGMMSVEICKFSNKHPVLTYERYNGVPDYKQVGYITIEVDNIGSYVHTGTTLESSNNGLYIYSGYQDDTYYAALLAKAGFVNGNRTVDDVASVTHTFVNKSLGITVIFGQGRVEIIGEPYEDIGKEETNRENEEDIRKEEANRETQLKIQQLKLDIIEVKEERSIYEPFFNLYQRFLSEAEADLAEARNKKVMVFQGGEFVYMSDPDAVNEALKEVEKYQTEVDYYKKILDRYDEKISTLEEQISILEAQM